MKASDYRKSELEEIVKIRRGEAKASLSHCTPYWHSDHLSVQRPNYFASVRMYSSRICNMEEPYNGEGLMNHHRGDGTNYISRTGDEYFDIAPVYDWQKIPGTTVMQKPALPSEKEIQKKGLTDFVGAVSDGLCGAAAFDFKSPHDPLQAKKAWFFFRDEYVCLGTGINSGSKLPVVTTLNQCRLRGEVEIMSDNQQAVVQKGMHQFDRVNWVFHDSIAYLFPKPQRVNLSNQAETGSWYHINHQSDSPKEDVSKDVFKLWIDHGAQVQDSGYEYLVVPAVGKSDLDKLAVGHPVEILSNTSDIQAVKNPKLNITQLVFYTSGEIQIANGLTIGTESPGLVMVKTDGRNVRAISVADPTQKLRKIHLTVTEKIEKSGGNFKSIWNDERGVSEIAIDLPQTVYAGKSVSIDL
jgi:chondroitin AC lyase